MTDYFSEDGKTHRHPIKIIVNPVLRAVQFWTDRPYVIASICNPEKKEFLRFEFCRVKYNKKGNTKNEN